jgi:hypothetical protein
LSVNGSWEIETKESTEMGSKIASVFVFLFVLVFVFVLWSSAAAAPAITIQPPRYARLGSLTAAEAVSLGDIALPRVTLAPSRYAVPAR